MGLLNQLFPGLFPLSYDEQQTIHKRDTIARIRQLCAMLEPLGYADPPNWQHESYRMVVRRGALGKIGFSFMGEFHGRIRIKTWFDDRLVPIEVNPFRLQQPLVTSCYDNETDQRLCNAVLMQRAHYLITAEDPASDWLKPTVDSWGDPIELWKNP